MAELECFQELTVGRELKMIELDSGELGYAPALLNIREGLAAEKTRLQDSQEDVRRSGEGIRAPLQIDWRIGELPVVECDPTLTRHVFANLLENAVKFTRDRSPAVIEVGWQDSRGVCFVKDNGVGFDVKYAGQLFGVFQRLHSAGEFEGTGIGLAIVRRMVNKHGGYIWAEAEPGKGTAFFFTLVPPAQARPCPQFAMEETHA